MRPVFQRAPARADRKGAAQGKMTLYDELPRSVTVDGRRYRLDLDFRNVLRMLAVMERQDLIPGARAYLALKCVM